MNDLRTAAQQALSWIHHMRREYGMDEPREERALRAALAQQAEPVQPVAWQWLDSGHFRKKIPADATPAHWRPLYSAPQQAEPVQEPVAWLRVIDEAMVVHHLGVADPTDDYETAKRKMNTLLCMAQDIGADFAKQAEPVAWAGYDLDAMVEAFSRVIEAHHSNRRPFHNPIDMDARTALRILRGFVPAMKAHTAPPKAEPERNFCSRCGKRLSSDGIHTCTPPQTKCSHCSTPLFAARQCRVCGRKNEQTLGIEEAK